MLEVLGNDQICVETVILKDHKLKMKITLKPGKITDLT